MSDDSADIVQRFERFLNENCSSCGIIDERELPHTKVEILHALDDRIQAWQARAPNPSALAYAAHLSRLRERVDRIVHKLDDDDLPIYRKHRHTRIQEMFEVLKRDGTDRALIRECAVLLFKYHDPAGWPELLARKGW